MASDAREENKGEENTPNPKGPCWPWCLSHELQHTPLLQVQYRILCIKSWPTAAASLQMGMSHLGPKLLSVPLSYQMPPVLILARFQPSPNPCLGLPGPKNPKRDFFRIYTNVLSTKYNKPLRLFGRAEEPEVDLKQWVRLVWKCTCSQNTRRCLYQA